MSALITPKDISAAILAGGLGTRLRSVVADRPKVVAEVGGVPFLRYLFAQLKRAGFSDAVLCTGHLSEQVRNLFGASAEGLQLRYSEESTPLGTGGAVGNARSLLSTDPVLVMNGDSFCDTALDEYVRWWNSRSEKVCLLLVKVDDASRYGTVALTADGKVTAFNEKGRSGAGLVNGGIYLFRKDALALLPADRNCSLEREIFPVLAGKGEIAGFTAPSARFIDIGTPESYSAAAEFFSKGEGAGQ